MLMPQQMAAKQIALSTTDLEDMQHIAARTECAKLPQEVKSALSLVEDSLSL